MPVLVAGTDVEPLDIPRLAEELIRAGNPDLAATLLRADATGRKRLTPTPDETEALLHVLRDPPRKLAELKQALERTVR